MVRRILFKVEKNRVLVPVGMPCPFGCKYCYTRGGEVGLTKIQVHEILDQFQKFALTAPFETIQFGYDGDPFARQERGIQMLKHLATMEKHLNFSTKAVLDTSSLEALAMMRQQMEACGKTLSALISLSCWTSAQFIEPHTPSPEDRIRTIINLKRQAIPVFIAIRPILPHVPDLEYEQIALEGIRAGCDGFILGPLYADDHGQSVRFIAPEVLKNTPSRTGIVTWSPHTPVWTRYEEETRSQRLTAMIEKKGGRVFLSSADAMELISRRRYVA